MKTQALKGMRDLLPAEQTLRDYIQGKILETYRSAGFERISTPMLEDMENLDKSEGGDNLNLIFKVLKRGDKLTAALNTGDPKQLSDMGLRYDLTPAAEPLLRRQQGQAAQPLQGHPDRPGVPCRASAEGPSARVCAVRYRHSG